MYSKIRQIEKGEVFGRLLVLGYVGKKRSHGYYKCECDCGVIKEVRADHLLYGGIQSCGCLRREKSAIVTGNRRKHGRSQTRLYGVFRDMKTRCYNKKSPDYIRYGARGITICDEWLCDYLVFEKWALENGYDETAPKGQCTIDRINNDKGYSPENCRFVTIAEQNRNKTVKKTKYGEEWIEKIKPIASLKRYEIARELNTNEGVIKYILRIYHTTLKELDKGINTEV